MPHRPHAYSWLKLSVLLALCCVALPLTAQAPFGVPLSDNVISVDVLVDDTSMTSFDVREGQLAAITVGTNQTIAVVPALSDDRTQVDFLVLELGGNRNTKVNQLDLINLAIGASQSFDYKGHQIALQPQSVKRRNFVNAAPERALDHRPADLRKSFGRAGGYECCVSCGALSVCATQVSLPCGSCEAPL